MTHVLAQRGRGIAAGQRRAGATAGTQENRDDLLTVEKTVIRFAATHVCNETSESSHDTSAQHNSELRQEHQQVDAGIVSTAKPHPFFFDVRIRSGACGCPLHRATS
jgi:hypothetical protein